MNATFCAVCRLTLSVQPQNITFHLEKSIQSWYNLGFLRMLDTWGNSTQQNKWHSNMTAMITSTSKNLAWMASSRPSYLGWKTRLINLWCCTEHISQVIAIPTSILKCNPWNQKETRKVLSCQQVFLTGFVDKWTHEHTFTEAVTVLKSFAIKRCILKMFGVFLLSDYMLLKL